MDITHKTDNSTADQEHASIEVFTRPDGSFSARSRCTSAPSRTPRRPSTRSTASPRRVKAASSAACVSNTSTYFKGARTTAVGFATRVFRAVTRRGLRSRRSAIANPRVRRTAPRARRSTRSRSGRDARSFGSRRAHSRPCSPFPSPRLSSRAVSPVNARR